LDWRNAFFTDSVVEKLPAETRFSGVVPSIGIALCPVPVPPPLAPMPPSPSLSASLCHRSNQLSLIRRVVRGANRHIHSRYQRYPLLPVLHHVSCPQRVFSTSSHAPKTTIKSKSQELPLTIKPKTPHDIDSSGHHHSGSHTSHKIEEQHIHEKNEREEEKEEEEEEDDDEDRAEELKKAHEKAIFATKLGAGVNFCLAIVKGGLGLTISSTALIADAANSMGDIFSDLVVYFTVHEARKHATPDRPWGRGKIEPLGMEHKHIP
jgi:hypothetical protein